MKNDSSFLSFNFLFERFVLILRMFNQIWSFITYFDACFLWTLTNRSCLIWAQIIWIRNSTLMMFILITYSSTCFLNFRWRIAKFMSIRFLNDSMLIRKYWFELTKNEMISIISKTWLLKTNSIEKYQIIQSFCK